MKILITVISISLVLSCNNTQTDKTELEKVKLKSLQDKYVYTDPEKNNLQKQFDAVLLKFDSLTVYNEGASTRNTDEVSKLTKTKAKVHGILLRDKLTPEEKQEAERLIHKMDSTLNTIK